MSEKITFYYNPMSRARIAHWMLEEAGADYEIKLLDFCKNEHKDPAYLKINPMGKVPAIVHRGTVITEGAAICAYLADAFPKAKLAPELGSPERGTYYRWLFFGAGCIEPALVDRMFSRELLDKQSGAVGYGSYDDTLNALEKALSPGPFILGQHFTAADVYIASQIGWGMMVKSLEPRAEFKRYLEACTDRPAYQKFFAQSNEMAASLKS